MCGVITLRNCGNCDHFSRQSEPLVLDAAICMEVSAYLIWIPGSRWIPWNIRSRFTRQVREICVMDGLWLIIILIMWERLVQENSQTCFLSGYCNLRHWLPCRPCREWCLCARCPCSAWMCPCKRWTQVAMTFLPNWSQDDELHQVGLRDQLEDDDDGCWRSEFCGSAKYSAEWKLSHSKIFWTSGSSVLFWRVLDITGIKGTQGAYTIVLLVCWSRGFPNGMLLYRALCQWSASWLMSKCATKWRYLTHSSVQLCAVEMLDKLPHLATDPVSKYTFCHLSLHFLVRLWLCDGLVARDYMTTFFLKWLVQYDSTRLSVLRMLLGFGPTHFHCVVATCHIWHMVMPLNTCVKKKDIDWVVVEVCFNSISSTLPIS